MEAILFTMTGFAGMEIFSWIVHKYIMHGLLWSVHKTHHIKTKGFFERNDLFSLFFGSVAVILIFSGMHGPDYRFWIGCGISIYGMLYFILHDVVIHRRLNFIRKINGRYLRAVARAHHAHHKSKDRDGAVCFGLLWVPGKYFRK